MRSGKIHNWLIYFFIIGALTLHRAPFTLLASQGSGAFMKAYREYRHRLEGIERVADMEAAGFSVIENQVFPLTTESFGEVSFIPAMDGMYNRLAVFIADEDGRILYRTDELETNNRIRGELRQPNKGIAAVSFQDMDQDKRTDIVLITFCEAKPESRTGKTYKVGDVLFQNENGFYRDYRLSEKLNWFGMNKSIKFITSFIRDGYSTEFLYTATTLKELLDHGFQIIPDQFYARQFEKLGKLLVVPGIYKMAEYNVFMIYLVNNQGYIVWSFQPMEDYEHLYSLKGISCQDIDGDGMKDIAVLGSYSYEGPGEQSVVENSYSIYYQRTGSFVTDTDVKKQYVCGDGDTIAAIVEKARAFWGWRSDL